MAGGVRALERVERFLRGLTEGLGDDVLLFIASDHGNLEDVTGGHTRNPVLGVAWGPGADAAAALTDVRQVCSFILGVLGPP